MKRLIYILFLFSLVLSSCNEELWQENPVEQDGIKLTIYNSALTKASDAGEAYERKINTLDCFFYPKGLTNKPCVFYHHEDVSGNTTGRVDVLVNVVEDAISKIFPTEGECEVFVIANLPSGVKPNGVTFNYDPENIYTSLDYLSEYVLQIADDETPDFVPSYDAEGKPFVMTGLAVGERTSKKNCTATVMLKRAASKITLRVAIPPYLDINDVNDKTKQIRMRPVFTDDKNAVTLRSAFHNGAESNYLFKDDHENVNQDLFTTGKYSFTYLEGIKKETNPSEDSLYVYECNVPFYTYSREWEKGASDAAYMTFEMPWGQDSNNDGNADTNIKTYYYQILVNGTLRCFRPNYWYDMFVKVGVIGSTVENTPMLLEHLMFYVLDWTDQDAEVDHPEHDVELDIYNYLNIQNPIIELDNETVAQIKYNASREITWKVTSAYTIDNSGVSASTKDVTINHDTNFSDDKKGTLTFIRTIGTNEYAPTYITLNVWLDFNNNDNVDKDEEEFLREVKITQYPMMYVIRDQSTLRSVYVNAVRGTYNSTSGYTTANLGSNYPLGYTNGIRNYDTVSNDEKESGYGNYNNNQINYSMFIISVTSFDENDEFTAPVMDSNGYFSSVGTGNYNNGSHTAPSQDFPKREYKYIIGDPRVRVPDDLRNLTPAPNQWAEDLALYDANGNIAATNYKRRLANYYPTESSGEAFRVVAPKFRIVSFNNASGKECTHHSAAMRCASLQEDGFPAGRWRLPTIAEIQYIIKLQENKAIQPIFTSSGSFYATASYGDSDHSKRIAVAYNRDSHSLVWNNLSQHISVRCVYDEWYWGSTRDAIKKTNPNQWVEDYKNNRELSDEYLFTWGDRPITW